MKTIRWQLVLSACVLVSACGDNSTTGQPKENEGAPARRAALRSIAENVIVPTYREFRERAEALKTAAATLAADPSADNRAAAQAAWTEATALWQRAELLQVGPAGVAGEVAGGKDLPRRHLRVAAAEAVPRGPNDCPRRATRPRTSATAP
jgi:predicted lipoprotein